MVLVLVLFAAGAAGYAWYSKHKGALELMTAQAVAPQTATPGPVIQASPGVAPAPMAVAPSPAAGAPGSAALAPPAAPAAQMGAAPSAANAALPGLATQAPVAAAPAPRPTGPRHIAVTINGPLETGIAEAAGKSLGPALTQVVTRALVWWVSVPGDLRRNDKIDVVFEERGTEEPLVDAVRLVSGKFGKTYQAYRYKAEGEPYARYYQANGEELEMRLRASPLDTYEQITSLIKDGRHHKGVDFKTPAGSKVKATFAGTITRKNWKWRANGNCLELTESAAPYRKAFFLHLSELPKSLQTGKRVERGEVIAESGNTGHSFAPHLHYQLMSNSERVLDPFDGADNLRSSLPPAARRGFEAQMAKWTSLMGPTTPAVASTTGAQ